MKNPTKELMAISPEDWLEEADRRERAGDKQGAKTARQFARFLMGQKDAFENPVKSRKENYNDFNEWEIDAFRAGATQVVRLGENLFSAIKMKDGSLAKLDKDGFVDMRSRTGQMVRRNSTTVGSWYGERGEINRQLVAKSGKSRPYENPRRGNDDPSREEMIEHIRRAYGREADEFDIEEAIYWFANDYHGGQGSNLYSALSTSEFRPGRMSNGPEEGSMGEMIYADLVDTFSAKKNPLKRRKGESPRDFVSRCMSEEKASFPNTKQRIAVCLSKSRKRNPVYDTGSDE
jgi:hypothetical protein